MDNRPSSAARRILYRAGIVAAAFLAALAASVVVLPLGLVIPYVTPLLWAATASLSAAAAASFADSAFASDGHFEVYKAK